MRLLPASACAAALLLSCCGPVTDPRATDVDLVPPQVTSVCATSADTIRIAFDENASLVDGKTRIDPDLGAPSASAAGQEVVIRSGVQSPGRQYTLEAEARDDHGNTASFLATFFGYNPRPPRLLINELSPRGSDTHPDFIEFVVTGDGDMGGVVLFLGTPCSYDARLIFPSFTLRAGSYVTVHLKPTGDPLEVDEPGDPALSVGADTSPEAWDFWMRGCKGLGGNNGAVSIFNRPGGECLDAVLYSNRTSQSDQQYRGFGSTDMMNRADELFQLGAWKGAGARVLPEDAINPEGSTGTRTLCRSAASDDTDAAVDWHVVPTRKASPGAVNSNDVYVP